MGTRNLTRIIQYGKLKVSKYCQWDGYPSVNGQGEKVRKFIAETMDLPEFKRQVKKLKVISGKALDALWEECGADPKSNFASMDISDQFKLKYPHLHRDMGGDILEIIQAGKVDRTFKDNHFMGGWNCEWVYELNLDKETLGVYKAGNDTEPDYLIPFADIDEGYAKVAQDYQDYQDSFD